MRAILWHDVGDGCTGAFVPPGASAHPVQTFLGGAHAMTSQRKPAFLRGGAISMGMPPAAVIFTNLLLRPFLPC